MSHPKRSKDNRNHSLHYAPEYSPAEGVVYPVMTERGPLVSNYLDQAYAVFRKALEHHSRILAVRFDLHIPRGMSLPDHKESSQIIRRFLASIQSKIDANLKRKQSPHQCPLRYIVAREIGPLNGRVHFHVMLLVNGHAYRQLGTMEPYVSNLFNMIGEAWASGLGILLEDAINSVQYRFRPGVCQYYLDPLEDYDKLPKAFHRVSYLCKAQTKHFGQWQRGLMTSRK